MFFKLKKFEKEFYSKVINWKTELTDQSQVDNFLLNNLNTKRNIKFKKVNINISYMRKPSQFNDCVFENCKFKGQGEEQAVFSKCYFDDVEFEICNGQQKSILYFENCRLKNATISSSNLKSLIIKNSFCWDVKIKKNNIQELSISVANVYNMIIKKNREIKKLSIDNFRGIETTGFYDNEYEAFYCTGSWHLKRKFEDKAFIHSYKKENKWKALGWKWLGGNYGESVICFSIWPLLIFSVFSCIYYFKPQFFFHCYGWENWFQPIYFSIVTFSTLGFGDIHPITGWGQFCVVIEVIFGYIFLGGIVSLFANKMIRKS